VRRRARALAASALASSILVASILGPVAVAHPTDTFDACLTRADVDVCDDTFSYVYGDTVVLRAEVSPVHDEAFVLRKAPYGRWERVDVVAISEDGGLRWRWRTHRRDAVQDAPYLLRFRIPGHGRSDAVEAFVLFGE
jgi:hypothetical protein